MTKLLQQIVWITIWLLAGGGIVMLLWNYLTPTLLHVSYWEAVAAFALIQFCLSPLMSTSRFRNSSEDEL